MTQQHADLRFLPSFRLPRRSVLIECILYVPRSFSPKESKSDSSRSAWWNLSDLLDHYRSNNMSDFRWGGHLSETPREPIQSDSYILISPHGRIASPEETRELIPDISYRVWFVLRQAPGMCLQARKHSCWFVSSPALPAHRIRVQFGKVLYNYQKILERSIQQAVWRFSCVTHVVFSEIDFVFLQFHLAHFQHFHAALG